MKLKDIKNKALEEACKQFKVRKLFVFGSVASGTATDSSDIDFLVEFERDGFEGAFDQFTGFKSRLEEIFSTSVDLYTTKNLRNPVFSEEIDTSKSLVYAA